jgi:hypothetical protein
MPVRRIAAQQLDAWVPIAAQIGMGLNTGSTRDPHRRVRPRAHLGRKVLLYAAQFDYLKLPDDGALWLERGCCCRACTGETVILIFAPGRRQVRFVPLETDRQRKEVARHAVLALSVLGFALVPSVLDGVRELLTS